MAVLHHGHAIGELAHQVQVVGDQQHRHPGLALQIVEQAQDLRAQRHVQRRGGLIGQQQARPARQGHGDHRALALAARELVRKAVGAAARVGNAGGGQGFDRRVPGLPAAEGLLEFQHLGHLVAHREERVQGRHRLLEDHGDVIARGCPAARARAAGADRRCAPRGGRSRDAAEPLTVAFCTRPSRASAVTVLPEPDSPTRASFSPSRDAEIDAVHDLLVAEGDAQLADVEQLFHVLAFRGSSASRSASPMNVSSSRVTISTANVESEIHQASRLALPWFSNSPSEGVPGGTPRPEEVQRGQRQDRRAHAKRQEGHHRRHAVGQDVLPHDAAVAHPQRPRGPHVVHLPVAQELGAHVVGQPHPAEQRQQDQQQRDAGREHRREDDQQVQLGHRAPDLDEALEGQVGLAAEVALHGAGEHADDDADHRERQPEQHADPEAVDQLRQQVAAAVVGAEEVLARRRGRVGLAGEVVQGLRAVGVGRVDRPVAGLRQLAR